MTDTHISDIWVFFKDFIDPKDFESAAEQYVDLLADFGTKDKVLEGARGVDPDLDNAIDYYLDDNSDPDDDMEELDY
jgi:hypothetical protein